MEILWPGSERLTHIEYREPRSRSVAFYSNRTGLNATVIADP